MSGSRAALFVLKMQSLTFIRGNCSFTQFTAFRGHRATSEVLQFCQQTNLSTARTPSQRTVGSKSWRSLYQQENMKGKKGI